MRLLPLLALLATAVSLRAEPEYPKMGPDLYDPTADGSAQIVMALTQAKAEHKHVLLMFGANWCIWCRRLHHTFETETAVAKYLGENYVLVLIDVNMRHGIKRNYDINERYGNPIKEGLPVFVVLDGKGRQLTTQETEAVGWIILNPADKKRRVKDNAPYLPERFTARASSRAAPAPPAIRIR